jgi:signal transduction histidine kinase
MQQDYLSLKQFTENASHEMQTPLAIIRSQIELLQQRVPTDESVLQHLQHIQRASSKLSRLNQALLLLTRLDNQQYESRTEVQLAVVLNQQVEALQALIDAKSLQLTFQVTGVSLRMHPDLADLLVNNLLSNAIRHNQPGGQVLIELEPAFLRISNTGEPPSIPSEQMFARFSKGTHSAHSLGLGLSIVKEICEQYQWGLHYEYADAWHRVEVQVEKAKTKNS